MRPTTFPAQLVCCLLFLLLASSAQGQDFQTGFWISGPGIQTIIECGSLAASPIESTATIYREDGTLSEKHTLTFKPHGSILLNVNGRLLGEGFGSYSLDSHRVVCHAAVYSRDGEELETAFSIPLKREHEPEDHYLVVPGTGEFELLVTNTSDKTQDLTLSDIQHRSLNLKTFAPHESRRIKQPQLSELKEALLVPTASFHTVGLLTAASGKVNPIRPTRASTFPSPVTVSNRPNREHSLTVINPTDSPLEVIISIKDSHGLTIDDMVQQVGAATSRTTKFDHKMLTPEGTTFAIKAKGKAGILTSVTSAKISALGTTETTSFVVPKGGPYKTSLIALPINTDYGALNTIVLRDRAGVERSCVVDIKDSEGQPFASYQMKIIASCTTQLGLGGTIGNGFLGLGLIGLSEPWDGEAQVIRKYPVKRGSDIKSMTLDATVLPPETKIVGRSTSLAAVSTIQTTKLESLWSKYQSRKKERAWKEALSELKNLMQLTGETVCVLLALSETYVNLEDRDQAVVYLERLVKLDPTNTWGWNTLGAIRFQKGDITGAETAYIKALQTDGTDVAVAANLSSLELSKGNTVPAREYAQVAIDYDPRSPEALIAMGWAVGGPSANLLSKPFFQRARDAALAKQIDSLWTEKVLANSLLNSAFGLSDVKGVEDASETLLKIAPNNFDALNFRGLVYTQVARWSDAQTYLTRAANVFPNANTYVNLSWVSTKLGELSMGINYADEALRRNPKSVEALNNRGFAFQLMGDLSEAENNYRAALAINPNFQLAATNLANLRKSQ